MYGDYDEKLNKARIYLLELKKKEAANARRIKISFIFLLAVVVFIIIRRILFPGLYRFS